MKHGTQRSTAPAWIVDYSAARARAIQWLGGRYLLAKPISASDSTRRGGSASGTQRQDAG
jgi:hypothetical protein